MGPLKFFSVRGIQKQVKPMCFAYLDSALFYGEQYY